MPPQLLANVDHKPNGAAVFHPKALVHRPEHGLLAMRVIATWAVTDQLFGLLVADLLHSDFEIVAGMLQALSGGESRRAAIEGAAHAALSREDMNLYRAVLKVIRPSRDRRNDFAHQNWGYFTDLEDAILLADPKCFNRYDAGRRAQSAGKRDPHNLFLDRSKILVFRKRDLDEEVSAADAALGLVTCLRKALSDAPEAAQARSDLLSQPQVQQAFQRMTNGNGR